MSELLVSRPGTEDVWRRVLDQLRREIPEQTFKIWLEPATLIAYDGATATIAVPDKFSGEWIQNRFGEALANALGHITGEKPALKYSPQPLAVTVKEGADRTEASGRQGRTSTRLPAPAGLEPTLYSRCTFDSFVIGPGNRLAHAAAIAVSNSPARAYNPFFIYGSAGLGKTHLMHAIAQEILSREPQRKICYITSEKFTNELIAAIQNRSTPQFRNRYRCVDVLLIDDVHFIAGKEATQLEVFHTFNALHDAHKQIVLASDRPPRDIPGLEERLVSRFGWGLVVDIQPPDFETRVAILKKKMERETVEVPEEVSHFIAKKIRSNIRELEGALIRVLATSSHLGRPVDLKLAQDVLRAAITEEDQKITIELIQKKVADYFNLKVADLRMKSRIRSVTFPRQIAMYLVRELTSHSLAEIGDYFGGRNHATVLYAYRKTSSGKEKEAHVRDAIETLLRQIRSDSY